MVYQTCMASGSQRREAYQDLLENGVVDPAKARQQLSGAPKTLNMYVSKAQQKRASRTKFVGPLRCSCALLYPSPLNEE